MAGKEIVGSEVMDSTRINRAITRIAHEIVERNRGTEDLAIVGIRTRGATLAQRLQRKMKELFEVEIPVGILCITLYRDDIATTDPDAQPVLRETKIPFSVDGKKIILVDDVLFTGRTIRSALDGIIDLGRPQFIQLVVLVDRGHRELPIRADYVGRNVPTSRQEEVRVLLKEDDGVEEDSVLIEKI